ncbi:MAG: DNA polymerase III subunit gamma/tau [Acidimicrobiia bacterium]
MPAYQALYRTHRPQRFGDVVGQGHVTTTLAREVSEGKVAHAYLFAGPRGTGKTTTARILAKALNCPNRSPEGEPCDTCDSCLAVARGHSFDVIELDAASHNSVDDVRELNISMTTVASVGGASRVFILDEAHMLSKAAANALLKTLEEPPPHVHFVLATTEPYRLLDTIRSRTQRFDFHPVSLEALVDHLGHIATTEGFTTDHDSLVAVARHATGSVRDSLSLLEQVAALGDGTVDLAGVRRALGLADVEMFPRLAGAIERADAGTVLSILTELDAEGVDLRRFVADAIGFFRGVFLAGWASNVEDLVDEPADIIDAWRTVADDLPAATVLRAIDGLGEGLVKIREGREERLMVELTLLKLVRPELDIDVDALRDRVDRLERALEKLASSPPPPAPVAASAPQPTIPESEPIADDAPFAAAEPAPVEPTEPPPAEPAPEPGRLAATLGDVQQVWPQVFGALRQRLGPRRQALFREAMPGAVGEGILELWLPSHLEFHLEQLQGDDEVRHLVAEEIGRHLDGVPTVRFAARPDDGTAGPMDRGPDEADDTEPLPDKEQLEEAPDDAHDPTALLAELGGEVIEDVTYDG